MALFAFTVGFPTRPVNKPFKEYLHKAYLLGTNNEREQSLKNSCVHVSRAHVAGQDKCPKTASGNRDVELNSDARKALNSQKQYTYFAGLQVFQDPRTLKPYNTDKQIREWQWRPALKKSGVRYRNPYQTRHTIASQHLSEGTNPLWVTQQMGHKNWSTIMKVYGKWIPKTSNFSTKFARESHEGKDRK